MKYNFADNAITNRSQVQEISFICCIHELKLLLILLKYNISYRVIKKISDYDSIITHIQMYTEQVFFTKYKENVEFDLNVKYFRNLKTTN